MTERAAQPSRALIWWRTIRPATLWAGAAPVVVGVGVSSGSASIWSAQGSLIALSALAGAIAIQIGCNLVNDYSDFERGADNESRLGPARAAAEGWLTSTELKRGALYSLASAGLIGIYLTAVGGWPILALGVASLISAYAYTAGPMPLAYVGLGDVFVLLFFGLGAVCGTAWLLTGALSAEALVAGGAVGALATAILVVNNLRDRHSDAESGKRTLAVRFGATAARVEYTLLVIGALTLCVAMSCSGYGAGWLAPLLITPLAIKRIVQVWRLDGAALNPLLGGTAKLELIFCVLLSVGLIAAPHIVGGG